ncbi:Fatty acid-binding protein type 3 [Trichoplax sp. H2]|nr:Fatty acid-binding protein type 3 [Trichoplax sp. H2]|eukprot:RDD36679.1 Fatty acid-binding protein type 3 [Trichoplax sp. H2]
MAEKNVIGKWKLVRSDENFENYMTQIGIGKVGRAWRKKYKPTQIIVKLGNKMAIRTTNGLFVNLAEFELGEELTEKTVKGEVVKTTYTFEGDDEQTLTSTSNGSKHGILKTERVVEGSEMVHTLTICDIVCKRYYKKVGEAPPFEKVIPPKPGSADAPASEHDAKEEKEDQED